MIPNGSRGFDKKLTEINWLLEFNFFFFFFLREKGIHIKVANSAGSTESSIKQESEKEIWASA